VFYRWLREHAMRDYRVLNLGVGPTPDQPRRSLKGEVAEIVGADLDPEVLENTELDRAVIIRNGRIENETASFDLIYSDYVLEHVEKPKEFLTEVYRLLKPGCSFFFRTPNIFHYVGLISTCTPHRLHEIVANPVRGLPKDAHKPWPTYYRMNSRSRLERLALEAGFAEIELRMIEPNPSYLGFHVIPFMVGVAYERFVNSHPAFSGLRANILGRFKKGETS
jgi:2-polyprenyl-3-methyl-5-hydroxy-6-metoxy-1,4-benzoquinol methylase